MARAPGGRGAGVGLVPTEACEKRELGGAADTSDRAAESSRLDG